MRMKPTIAIMLALFVVTLAGSTSSDALAQQKKKAPPRYSVATNSLLRLRLNDSLNSKNANVGDQFRSTVVDPVYVRGIQVIPSTSIVTGHVTHVTRAGRKSNAGSLNVAFTSVQLPNGKSYPLNGSLAASGSADNEGEVKGGSSKKRNVAFVAGGAVVGGAFNEGEVKGGSSKKRNVAFVAGGAVVGGLINEGEVKGGSSKKRNVAFVAGGA